MTDESQDPLHQEHDKLFKTVFSDPKEATSFFREYLPSDLVTLIDWGTLKLVEKEFIEEDFKKTESDLLYQVKLKKKKQRIYLYLLFEHQSEPDKWMRFRLLKYVCRIWDNSFKDFPKQKKLKPILPIVFYQGKNKWRYSRNILDIIEHDSLSTEFIPHFTHFLVDQSGFGLEEFQGETKARIAQLLLKMAFHGQMQNALPLFAKWLSQIEQTGGFDYVEFFIVYLIHSAQDEISTESIVQAIIQETQTSELGEKVMTLADRLKQEGREEGREEGSLIGKIQFAQQILKLTQSSKEELFRQPREKLYGMLSELEQQIQKSRD